MIPCTFYGSYYAPTPWLDAACAADAAVPEGCPFHFVTAAQLGSGGAVVSRVDANGATTPLASTTTLVDTVSQGFVLPDELSCDCAPTDQTIQFGRYAVAVPGARAGDVIAVGIGDDPPLELQIAAAATCPAPDWPTEYDVALACDPCTNPMPPGDTPPGDMPGAGRGCDAGGAAGPLLAALLLPLVRRRRL